MKCEWIHRKETLERLRVFLMEEENHKLSPGDMYIRFVKTMDTERYLSYKKADEPS